MTGNSNNGFTLVEVLIATMVMSIVMLLASNLLLLFFRSQDTSRNTLFLESEVRQILSRIVETSRTSRIDYDFYPTTPAEEPFILAFRTPEGIQTVYWFYKPDGSPTATVYVCANKPIAESCDTSVDPATTGDWAPMNDRQTALTLGSVSTLPRTAPYFTDSTPSDQPSVITVTMQMQLLNSTAQSPVIQTTFTPRIYGR